MINTKPITLDANTYFKLLLRTKVLNVWYAYLFPFPLAALFYWYNPDDLTIVKFLLVFGTIYPLWNIFYLWRHATKQHEKGAGSTRSYSISDQLIETHITGIDSESFMLKDLYHVKENKDEFLLYLNKGQFIYIPKDSITESEAVDLKNYLKAVNKL